MYPSIPTIYETFSRYSKPKTFPTCLCCLTEDEMSLILSKPLATLTAEELTGYASSVFLTLGTELDFKYFLPRILELCVNEEFCWPDAEVVLRSLKRANWDGWPEYERQVILDLLQEKFSTVIQSEHFNGFNIDEWVCALGQCVSDITVYLDLLLDKENEENLMHFVELNMSAFTEGKLMNGFWHDVSDNAAKVMAWLNQDKIRGLLAEKYGMVLPDSPTLASLELYFDNDVK